MSRARSCRGACGSRRRKRSATSSAVLADAGCTQAHVAKMTIHLVAPADIMEGFAAAQEVWGQHPTAITVLQVAALGRPDALVEIDALAQVPVG